MRVDYQILRNRPFPFVTGYIRLLTSIPTMKIEEVFSLFVFDSHYSAALINNRRDAISSHQGRNEVKWCPGQKTSWAPPWLNLTFRKQMYCIEVDAVNRRPCNDLTPRELCHPCPPRYAPASHAITQNIQTGPAWGRCNRCSCIGSRTSGGSAPWCLGRSLRSKFSRNGL